MSTVPASSNVMLAGTMLAFFSTCLVITFQAPLIWWTIPVVLRGGGRPRDVRYRGTAGCGRPARGTL